MQMLSPEKDGISKDGGFNPAPQELAPHFTDFLKLSFLFYFNLRSKQTAKETRTICSRL